MGGKQKRGFPPFPPIWTTWSSHCVPPHARLLRGDTPGSGRSWSCPSSREQTRERGFCATEPGKLSWLIPERAWRPPHQLSPQNLLTLRYLAEVGWSWETWSLVQAGACVQGRSCSVGLGFLICQRRGPDPDANWDLFFLSTNKWWQVQSYA